MKWYWKVRMYRRNGDYYCACIETGQDLREIDTIQDFYKTLTDCKMLLEGMSESPFDNYKPSKAFTALWEAK